MGTIELRLNFVVIILISFNFTSSFCFAGKTIASELLFQSKAASTVYIFTSSKPSVCALSLGSVTSPSSVAASQGLFCDIKRSPLSTVKPGRCFNWYNLYSSLALFSNKWPGRVAELPFNFLYINISTSVALVVVLSSCKNLFSVSPNECSGDCRKNHLVKLHRYVLHIPSCSYRIPS